MSVDIHDIGIQHYRSVLQLQEQLFKAGIERDQNGLPPKQNIILCSHFPVYTLGKNASEAFVSDQARQSGADIIRIKRGGEVTFHGPGQLVVYPILNLNALGLGLAAYVEILEQSVINSLKKYQVHARRAESAPGIWLESKTGGLKKIGAVGIQASRPMCMHGIAVNLHTDLKYFNMITPCGIADKGVSRLCDETELPVDEASFKQIFLTEFCALSGLSL
jgi:lipoyl(octanoyl) transferase